jgi:hypothetical protein
MIGKIRRLVLDTLKPIEPSIIDLARQISELNGINAVNISISEIDHRVESAKITVEGDDIQFETLLKLIQDLGCSIHSVDEVVAGKMIIDDAATLQD